MTPLEIAALVCMVAGSLVFLAAALGLLRLRDFYARLSGVTIAAGLAPALILLGLFLEHPTPTNAWKIGLALLIQLTTAAIGGNAMARAGYITDVQPTPDTLFDDLEAAAEQRSSARSSGQASAQPSESGAAEDSSGDRGRDTAEGAPGDRGRSEDGDDKN